ncbi:MAG TPA: hypothetical protein VMH36_09430 [Alphaproteobacteria bacterium]|nr:hypothetical protein [Alphaproteobacteria bacterium]
MRWTDTHAQHPNQGLTELFRIVCAVRHPSQQRGEGASCCAKRERGGCVNFANATATRGAVEPNLRPAVYRRMVAIIDPQMRETALTRFRDEYRRVKARLAARPAAPPNELRGLRIRLRIFLDEHRLALARDEAAAVRALIDEVDHIIAGL